MSFLYPAFLIGALAIAIPIVLHLRRRHTAPEVPFTAVHLLRGSPVEQTRRQRIRDLLLLAARVAALLLLAAAFARPYVMGAAGGGTTMVAVDRSLSMSAPGRFERALELAREAIDEAPASHQIVAAAFDERVDLLAPPGSRADARAALDGLEAGFGATRYARLAEAVAELPPGPGGTLVIVTDLQRAGWNASHAVTLPAGWGVEVRSPGGTAGNVALTSVSVESDRILATISNTWPEAREGQITVRHGDQTIASAKFSAAAGSTSEVAIDVEPPASGALTVRIDDPGGIPGDDARYHALGGIRPRVLIVAAAPAGGQPAFYMARALETPSGPSGFEVEIVSPASASKMDPDALSERALIVLASTRGLDRRARDLIVRHTRDGGGLWVLATPGLEAGMLATMFGWNPGLSPETVDGSGLSFAVTDPRHPIFRPFGPLLANLGSVRFERAWKVNAEGWTVLARFSDGTPALLERQEDAGKIVLFASDLDREWNDFPLHPSFVPFTIETARHLAGNEAIQINRLVGEAPPGLPARPGVYPMAESGAVLALNVDPMESEADTLDMDEFVGRFAAAEPPTEQAARLQSHQIEAAQGYWRYGVMLLLVVLVLESVIGRPRVV